MRIAICDDDAMYLAGMKAYLERWQKETGLMFYIDSFDNGDALVKKAKQTPFDIVFLDIIMPLFSGLETAKELRKYDDMTKIIFLTTSKEFALESYEVKASNYLIKPVTYEYMKNILNDLTDDMQTLKKILSVKIVGGYRKVYERDIEFLEARNKKVMINLKNGDDFETIEPLYVLENNLLTNQSFFKCHRSYIVNIMNVDYFDSGNIHMLSKKIVPIARGYGKDFEKKYFEVMFSHKE